MAKLILDSIIGLITIITVTIPLCLVPQGILHQEDVVLTYLHHVELILKALEVGLINFHLGLTLRQ